MGKKVRFLRQPVPKHMVETGNIKKEVKKGMKKILRGNQEIVKDVKHNYVRAL